MITNILNSGRGAGTVKPNTLKMLRAEVKDEKASRKLTHTAYHEAGHAVVAFMVQRRFRYVTICENEEHLGHIKHIQPSGRPDFNRGGFQHMLEKHIMISLAGPEAEHFFVGRRNTEGASDDHDQAVSLAAQRDFLTDVKGIELYLKWIQHRVRTLLKMPNIWHAVEAVANELMKTQTLRYNEACAIIQEAMRAYGDEIAAKSKPNRGE